MRTPHQEKLAPSLDTSSGLALSIRNIIKFHSETIARFKWKVFLILQPTLAGYARTWRTIYVPTHLERLTVRYYTLKREHFSQVDAG